MKTPDDLREPPAHRCAFCDRVVESDEHRFDETAGWVPLRAERDRFEGVRASV